MRRDEQMSETARMQPRWGRPLGALVVVVVLIAMTRGAWEVVVATAIIALLVGGYLLQRRARRQTVYDRHRT